VPAPFIQNGYERTVRVGPQTPWKDLSPDKQVTCMVAGDNNTHNAQDGVTVGATGVFNACAQLQQVTAAMVPVIQIGNSTAQNAPSIAAVANADGMVGLFNSVASRVGGALANTADAQLFATEPEEVLDFLREIACGRGGPYAPKKVSTGTRQRRAGNASKMPAATLAEAVN
jgi:hypothetical protein